MVIKENNGEISTDLFRKSTIYIIVRHNQNRTNMVYNTVYFTLQFWEYLESVLM